MTVMFDIHEHNPQQRLLDQAVELLNDGGVLALPTDCSYVLAARYDKKNAVEKIQQIRQLDDKHLFTLMCRDLSEIATFAKIDNPQYRLLKSATPGPWTFILQASKEVPKRLMNSSRKTIGIRVPDHTIVRQLIETLDAPLLGSSFKAPGADLPFVDPAEFEDDFKHALAGIVRCNQPCSTTGTTIVDLSSSSPEVIRVGKADPQSIGL